MNFFTEDVVRHIIAHEIAHAHLEPKRGEKAANDQAKEWGFRKPRVWHDRHEELEALLEMNPLGP